MQIFFFHFVRGRLKGSINKNIIYASIYMLLINSGIHLLRPGRDGAGLTGGINQLPYLFLLTFILLICLYILQLLGVRQLYPRIIISQRHLILLGGTGLFALVEAVKPGLRLLPTLSFLWVSAINIWCIANAWETIGALFSKEELLRNFGYLSFSATIGCISGYAVSLSLGSMGLFIAFVLFGLGVFVIMQCKPCEKDSDEKKKNCL
jgi:ATP:ADP antiporter, AAA family